MTAGRAGLVKGAGEVLDDREADRRDWEDARRSDLIVGALKLLRNMGLEAGAGVALDRR